MIGEFCDHIHFLSLNYIIFNGGGVSGLVQFMKDDVVVET